MASVSFGTKDGSSVSIAVDSPQVECPRAGIRTEVETLLLLRSALGLDEQLIARKYLTRSYDGPSDTRQLITNAESDWNLFLEILDAVIGASEKVKVGETIVPGSFDGFLVHLVCSKGAEEDILESVLNLSSSSRILSHKCGMGMNASPLHLACFFGCSENAIKLLIDASSSDDVLLMGDGRGRTPLHLACEMGRYAHSRAVVKLLLDSDVSKKTLNMKDDQGATPLQVASRFARSEVLEVFLESCLVADQDNNVSFVITELPEQLLLHQMFHPKSPPRGSAIQLVAAGARQDGIRAKDRRGRLPLHVAFAQGVRSSALKILMDNYEVSDTFHAVDSLGQTPSDVLIQRISNADEAVLGTLRALADADELRRVFAAEDLEERTLLDGLIRCLSEKKMIDLQDVHKQALLLILCCTPPGCGTYDGSLVTCKMILGEDYPTIYANHDLHKTLDNLMYRRPFTFFFMLDIAVRFLVLAMFSASTNPETQGTWAFALLYVSDVALLAWQWHLIRNHGLYYLCQPFNILDIITVVFALVSVALIHSDMLYMLYEKELRAFITLTGGLVWFVTVTIALRNTFLSFSIFVRGFQKVLLYLIPFSVVTLLMLGAFAEMYFKSTVGKDLCEDKENVANDFCEYKSSFFEVYTMFVIPYYSKLLSLESERNILVLTIAYSIIITIVTLQVLKAVVWDAFMKVFNVGEINYWLYRHELVINSSKSRLPYFEDFNSGCLEKLDAHLASVIESFYSRPAKASNAPFLLLIKECLMNLCEVLYLGGWFFLGLLSLSLLWPKEFRVAIFLLAQNRVARPEVEKQSSALCRLEGEAVQCRQRLDATNTKLEKTTAELEKIRGLLVKLTASKESCQ